MSLDWIGWAGLTPNEQLAAIGGGVLGAGFPFGMRALFGGLELRRKPKRKRRKKGKAKKKARR